MIHLLALAAAAALPAPTIEPLLDRVRIAVPDAREIVDLQVCPARKASGDGRRFITDVALSRPRQPRAYYAAKWEDGRVIQLISFGVDSSVGETAGFETLILHATERRFESCRFVSAADLASAWAAIDAR